MPGGILHVMEHKFAYLSGYIDGDGCFYVRTYTQKPNNILVYEYSIQICSVDRNIIEYFSQEFGGSFSKRPEKRSDRKDSFLWTIKTKQALLIANEIQHFIISKKTSCLLFISLALSIIPNKGISISSIELSTRDNLIKKIKEDIHMSDLITEEKFNEVKRLHKCIDPSEADFAYFAGLTDAEGCFRIQHWTDKRENRGKNYVVAFEIGNTKYSIFPWIVSRFGGSVRFRKATKKGKAMIIWELRSQSLVPLLEKLHPFLRVKKERCNKLIEFYKTKLPSSLGRNTPEFKRRFIDVQERRELLLEEFRMLNAKGKH